MSDRFLIGEHSNRDFRDLHFGLLGVHVEAFELTPDEWREMGFTGPAVPLVAVQFDVQVFGEMALASLPPFVTNVDAAALVIGALTTEFKRAGLGPALAAAVDQVSAQVRDVVQE